MLNKSEYILCKYDKDRSLSYVNNSFCSLTGWQRDEVIGKPMFFFRHPQTPDSMARFVSSRIEERGYFNGFSRCVDRDNREFWIFVDIGKRYSAEGDMLGFELIGYPPGTTGVQKVGKIYNDLWRIEKEHPGDKGIGEARDHLDRHIASLGVSYDEYICMAQEE